MITAPFPWFGGKSRAAQLIWAALGDVSNYIEPFAGSLGSYLQRPEKHTGRIVTLNDADGMLINVWRALACAPEEVARHADWPVSEVDLTARHLWLVQQRAALTARLQVDPDYYDPKVAGWWIWGACAWIGSGWCSGSGPWTSDGERWIDLRTSGTRGGASTGNTSGETGIHRQLPHLGDAGRGINRKLPHLGDAGRGINRKLPHLGDAGRGAAVVQWFQEIAGRLRTARICCGDWSRVCTPVVTYRHGLTGVVLDPPYPEGFDPEATYSAGTSDASALWRDVVGWAEEMGKRPDMRIVLCGYEGAGEPPQGWRRTSWTARGGYGNAGGTDDQDNRHRETLWLSPACLEIGGLRGRQVSLLGSAD